MPACVMVVSLLCGRTLLENPCQALLLLLLQMIWCNANRYLPWLWNLFHADHVVALSTESLVSALALSHESHLFCLQLFQVSGYLSVQISCCCSARPNLMLIFIWDHLGGHKAYMEIRQESLTQLSSAISLCSLA